MAQPNCAAMQRVVARFHDTIPGSQVRQVIQRYAHELYLAELAKSERVMTLVRLKVHDPGVPWPYAFQRKGKWYLQSFDRTRAQILLEDRKAQWRVYTWQRRPGNAAEDVMIRRVR